MGNAGYEIGYLFPCTKKPAPPKLSPKSVPPQSAHAILRGKGVNGVNGPGSQLDSVGWAGFINMYITAAFGVNR